ATRTARRRIQAVAATGLGERLGRLALSVGVEVLAVIVFALVAFGAYFGFEQRSERADLLFTTVALGVLIVRGVAALTRSLLAVGAPALRVVPLTAGTAAAAHRWAVALAVVVGVGTTLLAQLSAFELYMDVYLLVLAVVALAIALMIAAMIVRVRRPVARVLAGSGGIVGDLADRWHRFAVAYVLIIWALWIVHVIAECDTKVSAIVASAAIVIAAGGLDRFVHRRLDVYRAGAAGGAMGVAEHAARALVAVVAVMAFAVAWGFDPRNLAHGSGWGVVAAALFNITVAVLLAWLGWALIKVSLDRHLVPTATIGEDASIAGRTQTLLPLVRHFILTVLVVLTTLIVLSSLGVDIGPLLAGAGIVGLAIGFGAQTLVRDIVAGIFFLVDDAFRIGEYVEAGDRRGTVEGMSVRSLRLRHHRGAVHTIPFGELRSLTNHSRDWVIFKLELRLPFDADVVKARKLIKQVGQDMLNDEELGPLFLQPLKSQGVTKMDATAMVMAVKFMCRPNEQWAIRREAYVRIQAAFAANGIVFATQHITVRVPGGASERDVAAGTALVVAGD
ncbi:MAG: mechanosensitive ion channel family protein, partial [Proteobacteria bacterium]|nr:mechanosensitive ion channel family protein [Pseudomonadota bacterium]